MDQDDGDIKIGGVAATMQRYQYANLQLAKLNKAAAASKSGDSSTYSNVNLNMENEKSNSCSNDGGSLSSAITEELKKRKAVSVNTLLFPSLESVVTFPHSPSHNRSFL